MKLTHLRLQQVRQFMQPVAVSDLDPGLNLFTGPNESGKSTLVEAIRAAFFERHKSTTVKHLQPWGDSSAIPEISLAFEWEGQRWQLDKRFLKKERCDLRVNDITYSGDEAEEKLSELLGYQLPTRGASKPEQQGIPGLLWIEQGDGQNISEAVANAGDHLQSALGSHLGELASSTGDELMAQVQAARDQLLKKNGNPRGEYLAATNACNELSEQIQTLVQRISRYRNEVDRLAELTLEQQRASAEKPWQALRQQADEARQKLDVVNQLEQDQTRDRQSLQDCQRSQASLDTLLESFQKRTEELAAREETAQQAQQQVAQLSTQTSRLQQRREDAETTFAQARRNLNEAKQAARHQRLQQDIEQCRNQRQEVSEHLENAQQLQATLKTQRTELQQVHVDTAMLQQARSLHASIRELQIQRDAVATRLEFHLTGSDRVSLNGDSLSGTGERRLTERSQLDIAGVGQIRIHPGGEDIAALARQQQRLQDEFAHALAEIDCDTLDQAEQRTQRSSALQQEIKINEDRLQDVAKHGIDALTERHQSLQQQEQQLADQIAALPASADATTNIEEVEADTQLEVASAALRQAETEAQEHHRQLELMQQQRDTAAAEVTRLRAELESPQYQQQLDQTKQQQRALQLQEARLIEAIAQRQQQIDQTHPDILRQDIERLTKSADHLQKQYRDRELALSGLQSSIEILGAEGLEEQKAELELERERQERHRRALEKRADGLEFLLTALQTRRQELTQRLQAPLQQHLQHYLSLLFPDASLTVNDQLQPVRLDRSQRDGQEYAGFDHLSFGAREQMGVVSRLAYADLLQASGRPTLIILDDTLVHSDRQRLDQMKRILFDAAKRHQILLFSCHPDNWNDLGVEPREMRSIQLSQ